MMAAMIPGAVLRCNGVRLFRFLSPRARCSAAADRRHGMLGGWQPSHLAGPNAQSTATPRPYGDYAEWPVALGPMGVHRGG
jgi:hypothetical protein